MGDVDLSPVAALRSTAAAAAPGRHTIVYGDLHLGAADVLARSSALAAALTAGGTRRGDRVSVVGRNSPLAFVGYLACAWIGAVFVPLNFRLAPDEVRTIVADCGAQSVIAEPEFAALVGAVAGPGELLVVDDDPAAGTVAPLALPGWRRLSQALAEAPVAAAPVTLAEDDLAMLLYTSGTSGKPKGVRLTHGNLWWSWRNTDDALDTRLRDVTLAVTPLGHIGALNAFALRALVRGGTVVIARQFDAADVLQLIATQRVTTLFAVPSLYRALAEHPDFATTDLTSLTVPLVGGACASVALIETYRAHGVALLHSWGMTETAGGGTYLAPGRARAHATSVGVAMPYTRLKLIDTGSGAEIPGAGRVGEILVSGPNVTRGYWNNPTLTSRAIVGGWLHTGDCASRDTDGLYVLEGRIRDLIISGGENIYAAEVENALRLHPGVSQIAAAGVPDPRWGEVVMVFVVPTAGGHPTLEELRSFASSHLARFKLPKHLLLVDELPTGSTGKVDLRALRELGLATLACHPEPISPALAHPNATTGSLHGCQ